MDLSGLGAVSKWRVYKTPSGWRADHDVEYADWAKYPSWEQAMYHVNARLALECAMWQNVL